VAKFFPAVPAGGMAALKALGGPFPQARFCPTGGIHRGGAGTFPACYCSAASVRRARSVMAAKLPARISAPQARFCPTGGIGEADAKAWLALPNVAAVGGSWLAPEAATIQSQA
jgi:2-dehydro-3-deoxyphosphogluconate aldolase/(4S)-4-hydroxy-2-oxoglutarate aldolase